MSRSVPALLDKPTAFERGDRLYMVAPVVPHTPTKQEIEEYAFGRSVVDQLRDAAPNQNIAWFGGHYVEADRPNLNGAMWLGEDLAIASVTPMMMPVTVMHDPRTAVGVIAHAELLLPDAEGKTPRAKIDTALALWKHRFPEAVEEAEHNYAQGSLMQSMECLAPRYECSECRMPFVKLPDGAEKAQWCSHLKSAQPGAGALASADAGNSNASRILRGVTFTGTGLIFGTRGAKGADPSANLESFQEEVAEFHARQHHPARTKPKSTKPRSKRIMEIDDREYAELVAARSERDTLKPQVEKLEADAAEAATLKKTVETLEAEKAAAVEAKTAAEAKVTEFEEKANKLSLRDERWEKLGTAFAAKLDSMPTTKGNLLRDAEAMEEKAWEARLSEVEESTGVKRDAKKDGDDKDDDDKDERANAIFQKEEVAAFRGGAGGASGPKQPTLSQRRATMSGLLKPPAKKS